MVIVFVHILGLRLCAGNDSDISLVEAAFYQSGCSVLCALSQSPTDNHREVFILTVETFQSAGIGLKWMLASPQVL